MEKKLTTRDIKSKEKKEKIFKSAMKLFAQYGYEQVTTKMISAESDMSEGSIFHFFGEKAGILDYLLANNEEELMPTLSSAESSEAEPKKVIFDYLCKELEIFNGLGRDLVSVAIRRPGAYKSPASGELPLLMKSIQPSLTEYIKSCMESGRLKSRYSPYEAAYLLTAQGSGLTSIWSNFGENYSLTESGTEAFRILIDCLFED